VVLDAREVGARADEPAVAEPRPALSRRRLGALVRKEFVQIRRDRRTLGLIMFVPVTLMVIFGYAASFDVQHVRVEFIGNESAAVRAALGSQSAFEVATKVAPDAATARDDIKHGRTTVAITIDSTGRPAAVMIDGSGLLEAMTVQRSLAALQIRSSGQTPVPVDVLYNPSLKSANFMVPGLVGQIMVQVAMVLTAVGIVRERERGTIEQLMITPISKLELMVGKTIPYLAIAFVDLTVVILLGRVLFGVPVRGSLVLLVVESLLFLTASMGVGLLISTAAQTQQQAMQMAVFIQLPQMLLSGLVFPIASMPWGVRWISYLFPLTYFLPITRGIFLKGIGIGDLWPQTLVLVVMAVLFMSLAAIRFKKTLD
jgi:ABC-2 type transport system permease protein